MLKKEKSKNFFWLYIIIFSILGIMFSLLGFSDCKRISYSYHENNSVDYKVYLKENDYFETSFLGKDKTYITSLIDYLLIDYDYNVHFNEKVSGTLNYRIVGTISAEKANNQIGTYWEKSYNLTNSKSKVVNNQTDINIAEEIKVDYQEYNELLESFVNEYSLNSDGYLKIALVVEGSPIVNMDESIPIDSEMSVKIPLSKIAVEASVNTDKTNNEKEITKKIYVHDKPHLIFKILFGIDICALLYTIYIYIADRLKTKKLNSYNDNVCKIINDYSSIMVKVKLLNLKNLNIVRVDSFDDLLVVYNDVRTPINFYQTDDEAKFVVIFEHMAWEYVIDRESMEDYGDC